MLSQLQKEEGRELRLLVLGLHGSGKKTTLKLLATEAEIQSSTPTDGFTIHSTQMAGFTLHAWDTAAGAPHTTPTEQELADLFNTFDLDGSGTLDAAEVLAILTRKGGAASGLALSDAQAIVDEFDANHDGVLSIAEFAHAWATTLGAAADADGPRWWPGFYTKADAIIYVVDAADQQRYGEASKDVHALMNDDLLDDKPILVLANKQDLFAAQSGAQVMKALELEGSNPCWVHVAACSATTRAGLETGLSKLLEQLATASQQTE
jgi:GTPase SAR1 family protein